MIHYFNPGHETAVLNASPYYMAGANVVLMQRELAYLPAWYASAEDRIFVWDRSLYYEYLANCLPAIAQPVLKEELVTFTAENVCLWGISPQAIHGWNEQNFALGTALQLPSWRDEYVYLNSRQAARDCLVALTTDLPEISPAIVPSFCKSLAEVEELVAASSGQLLAKAPYSSSGRGLLWLPVGELTRIERQILHGMLKKQQLVSIESVLDKKLDFAMEFMSDGKGQVTFVGYSLFQTNAKGGYEGNYLGSQVSIHERLAQYIPIDLLDKTKSALQGVLSKTYAAYPGCIGVDMMVYDNNGACCLHPCVEINMRYNMGYLSLCFSEKYLHSNVEGTFRLEYEVEEGKIYRKHMDMQTTYPAIFEVGKLKSGYLALCPVAEKNHYRAYVLINESGDEIPHK